ncbi:hypothetical protein Tco_0819451 [Tanacetum coccineum]|uniref:Uncharacterized protein n=1 Tax=Tanacetum coccineum TaxID=301880 RepID=A0ABQ5A9I4_9ASTR
MNGRAIGCSYLREYGFKAKLHREGKCDVAWIGPTSVGKTVESWFILAIEEVYYDKVFYPSLKRMQLSVVLGYVLWVVTCDIQDEMNPEFDSRIDPSPKDLNVRLEAGVEECAMTGLVCQIGILVLLKNLLEGIIVLELRFDCPYQLVHAKFGVSSWRGARVDVRMYLLDGAIDGSKANGIIRDLKLKLESSCFTFDLVPLSYESVDVVVEENLLLRHKARMELQGKGWFKWVHEDDVAKTVFRMRNGHVKGYGYAFWVNQCTSGFHGANEPGGVRVAREDDRGVTEGREDVREVFQQRGSGA